MLVVLTMAKNRVLCFGSGKKNPHMPCWILGLQLSCEGIFAHGRDFPPEQKVLGTHRVYQEPGASPSIEAAFLVLKNFPCICISLVPQGGLVCEECPLGLNALGSGHY